MSSVGGSEEPERGVSAFQPSHDFSYRIPKELLMKMKQSFDVFDENCEGEIETKYVGTLLRAFGLLPTEKEMEGILDLIQSFTKGDKVDLGTFFIVMARLLRDSGDVENAAKMALRTRLLKKGVVEARSRAQLDSSGMGEGEKETGGGGSGGVGGGKGSSDMARNNHAADSETASSAPPTPRGDSHSHENKESFHGTKEASLAAKSKNKRDGSGAPLIPITDKEREIMNNKIITDQTTITMEDLHNAIIDQSGEPLSEEDALLLERRKYKVLKTSILYNVSYSVLFTLYFVFWFFIITILFINI